MVAALRLAALPFQHDGFAAGHTTIDFLLATETHEAGVGATAGYTGHTENHTRQNRIDFSTTDHLQPRIGGRHNRMAPNTRQKGQGANGNQIVFITTSPNH